MYVAEKLKLAIRKVENIAGKGENAGYQHFFLFPSMFSKGFSYIGVKKSWLCGQGLTTDWIQG